MLLNVLHYTHTTLTHSTNLITLPATYHPSPPSSQPPHHPQHLHFTHIPSPLPPLPLSPSTMFDTIPNTANSSSTSQTKAQHPADSYKANARKYLQELNSHSRSDNSAAVVPSPSATGRWTYSGFGKLSATGRDKRCGIRIVDEHPRTHDLSYSINWGSQDRKEPTIQFMSEMMAKKGPLAPYRKPKRKLQATGGAMGAEYPDPQSKHTPGPTIGKQIGRSQENKSGFAGVDLESLDRLGRQHGLKVRYALVQTRPSKVPSFQRSTPTPKPDHTPSLDLTPFTTEATGYVEGAYAATKRPLARTIRLGPGFESSRRR